MLIVNFIIKPSFSHNFNYLDRKFGSDLLSSKKFRIKLKQVNSK